MARPLKTDWFTWFTSIPASTMLVVCLFLPQFQDCHGNDKSAFDTSTAPMMIALSIIGVLPLFWRWCPRVMANYEELGGMCGVMIAIAFVAFFPIVGLFQDWYRAAYVTWGAAWMELVAMVTWTTAATTRQASRRATPARRAALSAPTDRAE
jgi:hypothetical protein